MWCAEIIDDIYGAGFVFGTTDGNVQDQNGHGTFVAGVVGAVGNNKVGVTGVNQVRGEHLLAWEVSTSMAATCAACTACPWNLFKQGDTSWQ